MIQGVIFDMDGLMIDSERVTFEGYIELCAKEGKVLDEPTYIQCLGKPVRGIWQVFYDAFGEDFPIPEIMKANHERMARIFETQGVPVKKGLRELLTWLKEHGYRTCVATSSNRDRVDRILELADLTDFFDETICGDEVEHGKPAPDIFLNAAAKLHLEPGACLVLEDSEMGIEAASRAGMDVVCVPDMKQPEAEYASRTTRIDESLLDVLQDFREGILV